MNHTFRRERAEMCVKLSASSAIGSMRHNVWANETVPWITSQNFNCECCWCLNWIVLCGFTSLQMCLEPKISVLLMGKPSPSVKNMRLLKKRLSPHFRGKHWQTSWRVPESSRHGACFRCKRYGFSNCSWNTRRKRSIVFNERSYARGLSSPLLVCVLQRQLFVHFSVLCS
jgi:hypothetical protein